MNPVVPSGTGAVVPSGTRSSCHRGPKPQPTCRQQRAICARNFTNQESFGFLLTDAAEPHPWGRTSPERSAIIALLNQKNDADKATLAMQPNGRWTREPEGKRAFTARPNEPDASVRTPGRTAANDGRSDRFTTWLTIDIAPALRCRTGATAVQRDFTVAGMLSELITRMFPDDPGDRS